MTITTAHASHHATATTEAWGVTELMSRRRHYDFMRSTLHAGNQIPGRLWNFKEALHQSKLLSRPSVWFGDSLHIGWNRCVIAGQSQTASPSDALREIIIDATPVSPSQLYAVAPVLFLFIATTSFYFGIRELYSATPSSLFSLRDFIAVISLFRQTAPLTFPRTSCYWWCLYWRFVSFSPLSPFH